AIKPPSANAIVYTYTNPMSFYLKRVSEGLTNGEFEQIGTRLISPTIKPLIEWYADSISMYLEPIQSRGWVVARYGRPNDFVVLSDHPEFPDGSPINESNIERILETEWSLIMLRKGSS
ncbi:MAG: hypothetical protein AABX51_07465, partial [Nanoarchaeota archaeon]